MNQPKIIPFVSFATHLFLLLFLLTPATGDLISDIHYLLDFSEAVPHGRKLNWDLTTPICTSWVGVTCTSDGTRVLALRLPGIGLSGPIPAHTLGKLDALRILSLRSNGLSGSLPSDISTLPSLQYLFLQHNHFSDIPYSLSPNLKVLDLSFNLLTGNIPLTFQNLTQLTGLSLQNNSLSGPIPDINLPKLRHLNLSNNNLNGSVPSSLQKFPNSSFTGNPHLCLSNCSPVIPSSSSLPPPAIFPKEKEKSRKKLGTRIIIAIAVGGAATLILLVLLNSVCYLRKKRKESNDEQAKPVLLCAFNDNTVRLYDLPSFNERGKIFAKEVIREIQIGLGGIFFTGNANSELKVGSGGKNQPQLASWDEA